MLPKLFAYPTLRVMYFTDQKRITKTVYCIRCVMVCKIFYCSEFSKRMEKTGKCKAFRTFACVHGRYLLYLTFSYGDRQTQRYFNVSSPSSRRDNKCRNSRMNHNQESYSNQLYNLRKTLRENCRNTDFFLVRTYLYSD